jgi:hypothetical protein
MKPVDGHPKRNILKYSERLKKNWGDFQPLGPNVVPFGESSARLVFLCEISV